MKKVVSWVMKIAGLVAGCALFSGIVRDQCEIAPYRPLIDSLRSDKADERLDAAMELGVLRLGGSSLQVAVLPLTETLDDPDSRVRVAAADTLAWFGPDAAPATTTLARIIRDDQSGLRARAIRVVCLINSDEARSILAEAMKDPDPDRRVETAGVIGNQSIMARRYVPVLLEKLRHDPTPAVRRAILSSLVAIEPASDRLAKARLEAVSDPDPETRRAAVLGLGSPDPLSCISLLRQAAGDHDAGVRVEAIRILSRIGLRHPDAVQLLCEALADPGTRREVRIAISHLNWNQSSQTVPPVEVVLESAVPALLAASKQTDPRTRGVIVSLLCRLICHFGREDRPLPRALRAVVPQLLKTVDDAEPVVRLYALFALLYEPPNELLLPVLHRGPVHLGEPSEDLARPLHNAWAVAIAAVDAKLQARDPLTKTHVLMSLLPEELMESLLPTISAATNDNDGDLRGSAMGLLADFAHQQASRPVHSRCLVRSILPAIVATLKSRFPEIREVASVALGQLGPKASSAVPALREMLANEQDPAVRARAEQSLRDIALVSKGQDTP